MDINMGKKTLVTTRRWRDMGGLEKKKNCLLGTTLTTRVMRFVLQTPALCNIPM